MYGAALLLIAAPKVQAERPPTEIKGTLSEVDGVRVLQVWGTPSERGYAHGYMLAEDIVELVDIFSTDEAVMGGRRDYEAIVESVSTLMKIAPEYQEELRGMLAGIENRFGGQVHLRGLVRALVYEDLVTLNCISDLSPTFGSAFAAWDSLTKNGGTVVGCALDWHAIPGVAESQIVLVQRPPADGPGLGWASVVWPGSIGCVNGMNAHGVTVTMLDVDLGHPDRDSGFVPRGLMVRKAIELRCERDPVYETPRAMKRVEVVAASNVLVSSSCAPNAPSSPAGVIEYVGRFNDAYSFGHRILRGRHCDGTRNNFVICTNRFERRSKPDSCERYRALNEVLAQRAAHQDPLTLDTVWGLLARVQAPRAGMDRWVTYQAVVFEPNHRRMHIALSRGGKAAPQCERASLEIKSLLRAE